MTLDLKQTQLHAMACDVSFVSFMGLAFMLIASAVKQILISGARGTLPRTIVAVAGFLRNTG
jgi:hypothetical protein